MSDPEEETRKMAAAARNHGCHPSNNVALWCETEIDQLRARVERLEALLQRAADASIDDIERRDPEAATEILKEVESD